MNNEIDPIEAVDRASAEGIDVWELLVSIGQADEEEMAIRRWRKGDCALRVAKHYGDDTIGKYADLIGTNANTLKQYRKLSDFYKKDTRYQFPNLFYTHYRAAMRLGDKALKALEKASARSWPVWKFEQFVDRCTGLDPNKSKTVYLLDKQQAVITDCYYWSDWAEYNCDGNMVTLFVRGDTYPLPKGAMVLVTIIQPEPQALSQEAA